MNAEELLIGREYDIEHEKVGCFRARILSAMGDSDFFAGVVTTRPSLRDAAAPWAFFATRQPIILRRDLCTFDLVEDADAPPTEGDAMNHIRLERTGETWLVFDGELLAESLGEREAGKTQDRWHDVRVYRTDGERYAVQVMYQTRCAGEPDYSWAQFVQEGELAYVLRSYEAAINVPGLPGFSGQAAMLVSLRRRYGAQVAQVLRDVAAREPGGQEPD